MTHLPQAMAQQLIADSVAGERGVGGSGSRRGGGARAESSPASAQFDTRIVQVLQTAQRNFVITNPNLADNPICYASPGFYVLTGYTPADVIGRNCRMLQGPDTDQRARQKIRNALARGEDCHVCMLNYRKDGSTFYNDLYVAPLHSIAGRIENLVGVQCAISKEQFAIVCEAQYEGEIGLEGPEGAAAAADVQAAAAAAAAAAADA